MDLDSLILKLQEAREQFGNRPVLVPGTDWSGDFTYFEDVQVRESKHKSFVVIEGFDPSPKEEVSNEP